MGVGGGWGMPPTHMHMHVHARTCMHAHACVVNMIISCKWPPPLGVSLGIPYDVIRACACMRVHVHMWGVHPLTTPHPHLPTPQGGDPRNQSKFNSTWTNRDISIPFEDLKSVETSPPMGGCIDWWVGGWVGWWVGSGQNTKNFKIVDWIKIIQFCLKIYDLWRHSHPWVGVGGGVGQWVGSGQMTNNWINLDLIEIIQFCLKIYDLLRHPHPWVGVWVVGWVSGSMGGVKSND